MPIRRLPDYVINKLKAGEIVERPFSIVKELLENALDAGSMHCTVRIVDGGKRLIELVDRGSGIDPDDLSLVLERYATSKIIDEHDLFNLSSYGFRGEALASIAEVARVTIQTKQEGSDIGYQITKDGDTVVCNQCVIGFDHGTIVRVEDLFHTIPVRQKFLKSEQTEAKYIIDYVLNVALLHREKHFVIERNGKIIYDLKPMDTLIHRVEQIYKKDRSTHLIECEYTGQQMAVSGIVSGPGLSFITQDYIKIFVNQRPVTDKIIKKAIMDVYQRQLHQGHYPLAFIFIDIEPSLVDVNVHPRKTEVRFLDPQSVYQFVSKVVFDTISHQKIKQINPLVHNAQSVDKASFSSHKKPFSSGSYPSPLQQKKSDPLFDLSDNPLISYESRHDTYQETSHGRIVRGQLWDMYLILESHDQLYLVDQHAFAERIAYEKMKYLYHRDKNKKEVVVNPVVIELARHIDQTRLDELDELGFDVALISDKKIVIYAIPFVLRDQQIDLVRLIDQIIDAEQLSIDHIVDTIFAMKACKISIKAGQRLSLQEIDALVREGIDHIQGMYVCQHGRPFFLKREKKSIDKLFDR